MGFYSTFLLLLHIFYTEGVPVMKGIVPPRQFCSGKGLEQKHPDPTDCGYYYFCGQSYSVRQRCAPGTFFHEVSRTCEFPENVPSCVEQLYGDAKSENSHNLEGLVEYEVVVVDGDRQSQAFRSKTRQLELNSVKDADKGSKRGTLVKDLMPKDQIDFNGVSFKKETFQTGSVNQLKDQNINQGSQDVVFEGRVIPKEGNLSTNERQAAVINGNQHESQDPFCVGKRPDHYPDPVNCEYFYQCSVSLSRRHRCAPGTVFNPKMKFCDHPGNVPSCADQEVHVFMPRDKTIRASMTNNVLLSETLTKEAKKVKISQTQKLPALPRETNIWGENGIHDKENPPKKAKINKRIVIAYKEAETPKSSIQISGQTALRSSVNIAHDSHINASSRRLDLRPFDPLVTKDVTTTRKQPFSEQDLASLSNDQLNLLNGELRKRLIALKSKEKDGSLPQRRTSNLFKNILHRGDKSVLKRTQEGLLHPDVRHFLVPLAGTDGGLQWFYPIPLRTDTGKLVWRYLHVPKPFDRASEFRTRPSGASANNLIGQMTS